MKMPIGKLRPHIRLKMIAIVVGMAVGQMAGADSGTGVDTVLGNALNPRSVYAFTPKDPEGLGQNEFSRSPSGFLLFNPTEIPPWSEAGAGWLYRGSIEAGVLGVSGTKRDAQGFVRYRDLDDGPYLNTFGLEAEQAESARFFEAFGGGAFHDDQYFSVRFGRYNDWRVRAFYNETRHVFSTTFRSLHSGVGHGNLTLSPQATAAGLRPGGVDGGAWAYDVPGAQALAATALQDTKDAEISLVREKGGIRFDMTLDDRWKVFASYSNEKRSGARPFAAVAQASGGGQQSTELAEPIDYHTHDFLGGIQYADDLNALNVTLAASLFRNHTGSLTYQNPWPTGYNTTGNDIGGVTPANGGFATNTLDLYPDNNFYNLKGEYARIFPEFYKGRFTAVVSLSSSRQDDDLLPYTNNGNLNAVNNVTAGTLWNSTSALSRQSADAKIDTTLVDLSMALTPIDDLTVKGRLRYYETDNSTKFLNCNPNATYAGSISTLSFGGCTGVWGRIAGDGSGPAILNPNATTLTPGGNQGYLNLAWDRKELLYSLYADYRLNNFSSINGTYENESIKRSHREVDKTREDKLKLGYVHRAIGENGTLRASYEYAARRGSSYDANPYDATLGGAIFAANGLDPSLDSNLATGWVGNRNTWGRKFDLADRDQGVLNLRYNHIFRPDLDGGVSIQVKRMEYPDSRYGRVGKEKQDSINFDLNYQPSPETSIYGFYSYQYGRMSQRGTAANSGPAGQRLCTGSNGYFLSLLGTGLSGDPLLCANPALGAISQWNPANNWEVDHSDRNHTAGFGVRQSFGKLILDVNYIYSEGTSRISYSGIGSSAAPAAGGGGEFPDMRIISSLLQANLIYPLTKEVTARLLYAYESGKVDDWHYAGNVQGNLGTTSILVDAGPERYDAHLVGLLFNVRF